MALFNDTWSFDGKTIDEVVRAYTAFKGWRTRNVNKFEHLSALEKGSHSPISVASIITALDKIELYSDKLAAIAQYLEDNAMRVLKITLLSQNAGLSNVSPIPNI